VFRPLAAFKHARLVVVAAVALAYGLFIGILLSGRDWDTSYLVVAGSEFVDRQNAPASLQVWQGSTGYDGQFFYRLALDPFSNQRSAFGVELDHPAYRQQRILYPLIAWALAFGDPDRIATSLLVVNYMALCALGWLGASLAQSLRRAALWGLAVPLYPGFLLSLSRDLAEIVEVAFVVATVLLIRKNRHGWAAGALSLAALTRETALVVPVGLAMASVFTLATKKRLLVQPIVIIAPFVVACVWQSALFLRWGELPVLSSPWNMGMPFAGAMRFVQSTAFATNDPQQRWLVEVSAMGVVGAAVIVVMPKTRALLHEKLAWLGYSGVGIVASEAIWVEDWAFLRALAEWFAFAWVALVGAPTRWSPLVLGVFSLTLWVWFRLAAALVTSTRWVT
jgi:hypothetical protein